MLLFKKINSDLFFSHYFCIICDSRLLKETKPQGLKFQKNRAARFKFERSCNYSRNKKNRMSGVAATILLIKCFHNASDFFFCSFSKLNPSKYQCSRSHCFEIHKKVSLAIKRIQRMTENTHHTWVEYSRTFQSHA